MGKGQSFGKLSGHIGANGSPVGLIPNFLTPKPIYLNKYKYISNLFIKRKIAVKKGRKIGRRKINSNLTS